LSQSAGKLFELVHCAHGPEKPLFVVVDIIQPTLLFHSQSGQNRWETIGNRLGFILSYCPTGPVHQFQVIREGKGNTFGLVTVFISDEIEQPDWRLRRSKQKQKKTPMK